MNDEPTIGSPPMPTIVELPEPEPGQLVADLVRQRPRARHEPDRALGEDLGRDDPDVRLPRRQRARAVRAEHRDPARPDVVVDAQHLVRRQALGDADHRLDPGVDGLVDRVRREARRDEDHRRVRAGLVDRLGDGVEDRDALDVLAALARASRRRRPACRSSGCAARGTSPRGRSAPGRRAACPCRRRSPLLDPLQRHSLERDPAVLDAVGDELAHARGVLAGAAGPLEPRLDLDRAAARSARRRRRALRPRTAAATRRPCSSGRATGRAASRPPRARRRRRVLSTTITSREATRAISRTRRARRRRSDARASRVTTTSKLASANGSFSRRRDDVRLHSRRRVHRRHLEPGLAQPPGDVPAAGSDVERRLRARRPLDDQIEIAALAVRGALAVGLGPVRPDVGHFAQLHRALRGARASSARRADSAAPRRRGVCRPSSAFVPSSRTTIGWSIVICSSACEDPARDLVAAA